MKPLLLFCIMSMYLRLMVVECILKSVGAAVADLQLPMQSVPITIKVVSLNPTHGEVY